MENIVPKLSKNLSKMWTKNYTPVIEYPLLTTLLTKDVDRFRYSITEV